MHPLRLPSAVLNADFYISCRSIDTSVIGVRWNERYLSGVIEEIDIWGPCRWRLGSAGELRRFHWETVTDISQGRSS